MAIKLSQKSRDNADTQILKQKHRAVQDMCDKAKKEYYNTKINDAKNDQKELFKICYGLLHKTKNTSLPTYSSKKELADQIVSFFMEKIAKIRNEMSPSHPSSNAQIVDKNTGKLDSFHEVSEEQISKLILKGNSKSCCLDHVTSYVYYCCSNSFMVV